MDGGGELVGLAWTVAYGVVVVLAALGAVRFGLRLDRGWDRWLGAAVVVWCWSLAGLQVLGSVELLNRPAVLGWGIFGLVIAGGLRVLRGPIVEPPSPIPTTGWDGAARVALGLTIAVVLMLATPSLLLPPKIMSDGPIYHLYFAAKWWKAGRIFDIATPFGETAATYFPANGDLGFAGMMTLGGGDRLARVGQLPFLLLSVLAVYAIARKVGASGSASLIAACWYATSTPLLVFAVEANVDSIFVAGYLLAVYFCLDADGSAVKLTLAGLAAGAAWGTKATAMVFVPPLLLAMSLQTMARPGSWWLRGGRGLIPWVAALVPSIFWFARNLFLTGNPLYPLHLAALGRVALRGWYNTEGMRTSRYHIPVGEGRWFVQISASVFDPRLAPLWILGLIWGLWGYQGLRNRPIRVCLVLAVLNLALYWLVIPYRTQQRFMFHALGLAAVPLAGLLDRSIWLRRFACLSLAVHLVTPQSWLGIFPGPRPGQPGMPIPPPLVPIPLSLDGWMGLLAAPGEASFLIIYAILGVLAALIVQSFARVMARPTWPRRLAAWGTTLAVAIGYPLAIQEVGKTSGVIYPHFADYASGWRALEAISPPEGTSVAYAGTNLPYYLMAGGLRNSVVYINIDGHPNWLLHDYHLSAAERGDPVLWPTSRPGWDRIHPDEFAWLANFRANRVKFLVVARCDPLEGEFNLADAEGFPIERVWADRHPEAFERVYPRDGRDPRMRIYRVRWEIGDPF